MNQLNTEERTKIAACLVEGCSLRATVRMTGFAKKTVSRFLVELGQACAGYHDRAMVNLPCQRIQVDEIWAFCYAKQANLPEHLAGAAGYGDIWTWVAIDADSKLIPSWYAGNRDEAAAYFFLTDLAKRLANRVQLTSDGHTAYVGAVESAFGADVDYAQLVKMYGRTTSDTETRYSPPHCIGARKRRVMGKPDRAHISTSFAERSNLTMRMSMRRFTRLTNGHSKKFENHKHALALHFMHYNFCRIHQSLRVTPAMQSGLSDHVWELEELVGLMDL